MSTLGGMGSKRKNLVQELNGDESKKPKKKDNSKSASKSGQKLLPGNIPLPGPEVDVDGWRAALVVD